MGVDVAFFRDDGSQRLAAENDPGLTVSGSRKLAQRFLLHLFTPKKSVAGLSGGSDFLKYLSAGVATDSDLFSSFAAAVVDVLEALRSEETAATPANERIAQVSIGQLVLTDEDVSLGVKLRTKANGALGVTIPLTFVVS